MITDGQNRLFDLTCVGYSKSILFRGNAAGAAEDLRELYGVQLFVVAVGATRENLHSLTRVVGMFYFISIDVI